MGAMRFNPDLSPPPRFHPAVRQRRCSVIMPVRRDNSSIFPTLKLISLGLRQSPRIGLICNATDDSGEHEFSVVLDAFFLGKALADALTERIDSTVGVFLREQQKQILAFQEDVLDRARRGKRLALVEIKVAQGLINSTSLGASVAGTTSSVADFVVTEAGDVAETGTLVAGAVVSEGVSAAEGIAKTGTSVASSGASAAEEIAKTAGIMASSAVPKGVSAAEDIAKGGTSVVSAAVPAADDVVKTGTSVADSVISAAESAVEGVSTVEGVAKTGTSAADAAISKGAAAAKGAVKTTGSVISEVLKHSDDDPFFGLINKG